MLIFNHINYNDLQKIQTYNIYKILYDPRLFIKNIVLKVQLISNDYNQKRFCFNTLKNP